MTGIVIVSHSKELAEGLRTLALQMGQGKAKVAAAGGVEDPDDPIGTDAMKILTAIEEVFSEDGVIVFMDMGSAILSAEMALDFLDEEKRSRVYLSDAPLAEGVIAATVMAANGGTLNDIQSELGNVLDGKRVQLGRTEATSAPLETSKNDEESDDSPHKDPADATRNRYTLENTLGLHARPAAKIAGIAGQHQAKVTIRNISAGSGKANAKSINALIALQARQGDEIEVEVRGLDNNIVAGQLDLLLKNSFNESKAPFRKDDPKEDNNKAKISESQSDDSDIHPQPLRGIPVYPGIAIAPPWFLDNSLPEISAASTENPEEEKEKLKAALEAATSEIQQLRDEALKRSGKDEAEIFDAHKLIANDPELISQVQQVIIADKLQAAYAWRQTVHQIAELYRSSASPILAGRAADVVDVGQRVLRHITGERNSGITPNEPCILVTEELNPSDVAGINKEKILGIITEEGSDTSHSAILVRSLGIPAVFGVSNAHVKLARAKTIILDADNAEVHINPSDKLLASMQQRRQDWLSKKEAARQVRHSNVRTSDGEPISVQANISSPDQVQKALELGAEGIGLYRTEFLFMGRRDAPDENEQFKLYKDVAEVMDGKPVTIRTIDIGGDKPVSYLNITKESNPFMGWRGIRYSLDNPELFRTQLRAIYRASAFGNLRLMFPMIATIDEWTKALRLCEDVKSALRSEGVAFNERMPLGMMVEVPSAVVMIESFLGEVDFISIGTNDLTQYVMAADRMNGKVAGLASYHQPAVMRMIETTVRAAVGHGTPVSMCGEMARDTRVTRELIGYGLRTFSMSASGIPEFKLALQ